MKKKKVLFLSAASNIHTIRWVNALSDFFEIHLVYCKGHDVGINKPAEGVVLHELKYSAPLGYYTNAKQLKTLFKQIEPEIVNVHYASGYGTLARCSKIKPVLLSVWGSDVYDFPNESKLKEKILQRNVKYANAIASTSYIMAEELKKHVQNCPPIYITPFGVDIDKFKRFKQNNNDEEICIGNVKTLKPIYGIEYEILAIKRLREFLKEEGKENLAEKIRMRIYGDGEEKDNLLKLIEDNKLEKYVKLMGNIPNYEVPKVLNELDIFCVTSNKESFGVAVVEAMACGLPIVATDTDGFCEVMEDGVTGYVVERKNVEQIAMALKKLVLDEETRKNMGTKGRKRAEEKYNWIQNVDNMKEIYERIMNNK